MGYKITKESYKDKINIWKARKEIQIVLLALELDEKNKEKLVRDLNFKFLRKKQNNNKNNYSPTRLQRAILNNEGY